MKKLLAQTDPNEIIGTINPLGNANFVNSTDALGNIIANGIRLFITFAALVMLVYLLWGAFDWITSEGDKEKLEQARHKITNAVIGMILIVASLGVFSVVTGNILGVIKHGPGGWEFQLPQVGGSCIQETGSCTPSNDKCCEGLSCAGSPPRCARG